MTATLDDTAVLALHEAGKSTRKIATILGDVHWTTIARRLKHLTPRKTTEIYKELRADIFAEKQRQLLMRSYKANPKDTRDLMTSFGILYDKEQNERGHGADARPLVMIQINTGKPEPVDKTVDNLIPNHINTIEVR